ncbi:MAG: insulinase family protein, partial [Blastocatellia bacterium]
MIKARSLTISIIIGSIFVGTASFAQQSEDWRRQAPPTRPARAFDLPVAREVKLENGLTLVMIEDHRTPLVTINAGLPQSTQGAGASGLMSQVALAEATGELLTEGAGARTSEQLAREVETLGGQISSSASSDYAIVSAAVISENAEAMIGVLADVLARPAFHSSEVALYKNNRIENLTLDRQNPSFLVREHFNRVIYGSHPYGIVAPTPEVVRLITREKIARFYESSYSPAASVVVIVGDFDSTRIEA